MDDSDQVLTILLWPIEYSIKRSSIAGNNKLSDPQVQKQLARTISEFVARHLGLKCEGETMGFAIPWLSEPETKKITFESIYRNNLPLVLTNKRNNAPLTSLVLRELYKVRGELAERTKQQLEKASDLEEAEKAQTNTAAPAKLLPMPNQSGSSAENSLQDADWKKRLEKLIEEQGKRHDALEKLVEEQGKRHGALEKLVEEQREELKELKTALRHCGLASRLVVVREMANFLRDQVVTRINANMTFDAILASTDEGILAQKMALANSLPDGVLEKLAKKSIWHQDGNAAAHMVLDMDRLHDAVYALSIQDPDLITAFDAVAAFTGTTPYAQIAKYKRIQPYPVQQVEVQTTAGIIQL